MKRALAMESAADEREFTGTLRDICGWYNHDRPHDHLQGRTTAKVWARIDVFAPRARSLEELRGRRYCPFSKYGIRPKIPIFFALTSQHSEANLLHFSPLLAQP
ncbi:MAG: hypothetical protein JSR31_15415 [Nitrospira sp.]|nr:hypothetical protein [Nitrospira sp.]